LWKRPRIRAHLTAGRGSGLIGRLVSWYLA
jgi:hypothetical protein